MTSIEPPSTCPACDGELEWIKDLLYCTNPDCSAKISKRMEHFVKTLKIKGLGPKTLEKLELSSFDELFRLTEGQLAKTIKSEKVASKLYSELENAAKAPANMLLPAFGVPLIGKTATEKLSTVCYSIFDIDRDSCEKAGLGPKATKNLLTWFETEFAELAPQLPFSFEFEKPLRGPKIEKKGVVCISGKLSSFKTKAEATVKLEEAGYVVKSSLTKDVTILVNESGIESSKTKKARDNGVEIVTNLTNLIGD